MLKTIASSPCLFLWPQDVSHLWLLPILCSLHLILFLSCIDVTNCSIFSGCCIQHHPLGGYCSDLPECPCTPLFYPMVESVLPPTTRWLSASPEIQPYAQASLLTTSMAKPSKVSISLQFKKKALPPCPGIQNHPPRESRQLKNTTFLYQYFAVTIPLFM